MLMGDPRGFDFQPPFNEAKKSCIGDGDEGGDNGAKKSRTGVFFTLFLTFPNGRWGGGGSGEWKNHD